MKRNFLYGALVIGLLALVATGCVVEARGSVDRVGQVNFIGSEMDPVINMGQLGNRIDFDADNNTSIRASADNVLQIEVNAEDVVQVANAAVTLHNADASDFDLVFDGNAQDFYICLDDTADDLVLGLGSACGTTPALAIDENQVATFSADPVFGGTTPVLTIGDAGAEDAALVFDGNAQDYYVALDDGTDDLYIGLGSAVGTTVGLAMDENQDLAIYENAKHPDAVNSGVVYVLFNTLAYTDTVAKDMGSIPADANIVDVMFEVVTVSNGGATDTVDCGINAGDVDAYVDAIDADAATQIGRTGDAADMPVGALGDVGAAIVQVDCIFTDSGTASAGAFELWIYYWVD